MERKSPIENPDSLQRTRNRRAPSESRNLRETGNHVPRSFPDTEPEPPLEPPVEKPPRKPFGLSRGNAKPDMPGGNKN